MGEFEAKLATVSIPEEDKNPSLETAYGFAKIGAQLIAQEPGFKPTEDSPYFVFELAQCKQCLDLFMEGIFYSMSKAFEMQLKGQVRDFILKNLAQDVFLQSKNLIATTVGPDVPEAPGLTKDDLPQYIHQTAESALMYYVSEYEKQYGPIQEQEALPEELAQAVEQQQQVAAEAQQQQLQQQARPEPPPEQPEAPPPQQEEPAQQQVSPQPEQAGKTQALTPQQQAALMAQLPKPSPYDKWGAMALFLSLLKPAEQQAWLGRFSPEQQQVIQHFSNFDRIANELHVPSVTHHLLALKDQIIAARQSGDYQQARILEDLKASLSKVKPKKVEEWANSERQLIRHWVLGLLNQHLQGKPLKMKRVPKLPLSIQKAVTVQIRALD